MIVVVLVSNGVAYRWGYGLEGFLSFRMEEQGNGYYAVIYQLQSVIVLTAHCRIEHQPWLWTLRKFWDSGDCCLVLGLELESERGAWVEDGGRWQLDNYSHN